MLHILSSIILSYTHLSDVPGCLFTLVSEALLSCRCCQWACVWSSCLSAGHIFSLSLSLFPSLIFSSPFLPLSLVLKSSGMMVSVRADLLFSPSSLSFTVSLLGALALWFTGSLWGEATGDLVCLQNCTEICPSVVPRRDHRQILRFSASFVHAHRHTHIPGNTASARYAHTALQGQGCAHICINRPVFSHISANSNSPDRPCLLNEVALSKHLVSFWAVRTHFLVQAISVTKRLTDVQIDGDTAG